jgi:hypothetical protein
MLASAVMTIVLIFLQAFEPEQLEDLEGVLWKSYFA